MKTKSLHFFSLIALLALLVGLFFSGKAALKFAMELPLKEKKEVKIVQWEVKEKKGKFFLFAAYELEFENKIYTKRQELKEGPFINEYAAILALQKRAKKPHVAFYFPKDPSRSSLEKGLFWAPFYKALLALGVSVYFCYLKRKVFKNFVTNVDLG